MSPQCASWTKKNLLCYKKLCRCIGRLQKHSWTMIKTCVFSAELVVHQLPHATTCTNGAEKKPCGRNQKSFFLSLCFWHQSVSFNSRLRCHAIVTLLSTRILDFANFSSVVPAAFRVKCKSEFICADLFRSAACPDEWFLVRSDCKCLGIYHYTFFGMKNKDKNSRALFTKAESKSQFLSFLLSRATVLIQSLRFQWRTA